MDKGNIVATLLDDGTIFLKDRHDNITKDVFLIHIREAIEISEFRDALQLLVNKHSSAIYERQSTKEQKRKK